MKIVIDSTWQKCNNALFFSILPCIIHLNKIVREIHSHLRHLSVFKVLKVNICRSNKNKTIWPLTLGRNRATTKEERNKRSLMRQVEKLDKN